MAEAKIRIGADHRPLDNAIGRVKQSFKGLGSTLKSIVGSPLTAIFGALSFARAISEVKKLTDALDNIGKGASRLSVTTAEFQELEYAAKRSGAEMGNIETAFKTMSTKIFGAKNGMAEAKREIAALGLTLADLEGKSRLEQFKLISQALSEITDPGTRAALAVRMFGDSGASLLPMIATVNQLGGEFRELGATIEDSAVKAAEKLKDQMLDLDVQIKALVTGSGIIEWLANITTGINEVLAAKAKLEKGDVKTTGGDDLTAGSTARDALAQFVRIIGGGGPGVGKGGGQIGRFKVGSGLGGAAEWLARKIEGGQNAALTTPPTAPGEVAAAKDAALADDLRASDAAIRRAIANEEANAQAKKAAVQKELNEGSKELFAAFDAEETAANRATDAINDQLQAMRDQLEVIKLINAGKAKEAAMLQEIQAMEKAAGRPLTDEERQAATKAAGELFDAQQKAESPAEKLTRMNQQQIFAGGVAGVGGGGGKMLDIAIPQLDQQRNQLLKDANAKLDRIANNVPANNDARFN